MVPKITQRGRRAHARRAAPLISGSHAARPRPHHGKISRTSGLTSTRRSSKGPLTSALTQRSLFFAGVTADFVFDIFLATRHSTDERFSARVKLPPPINSEGHDYGPALTPDGHTMFFSSGVDNPFAPGAINHLYVSERQNDRAPWGPRLYLDTLNCPTCFGGLPTIRASGQEICWMGDRGDSFGDRDIYCAMRR